MDKCENNVEKAIFFINKIIENGWSRAVLLNFLDTNLYERQGKAINNFQKSLPNVQSNLAKEITKDSYNFDFISIREEYNEKELKDALMSNIQKFLLELGTGICWKRIQINSGRNRRIYRYVILSYKITLLCSDRG